MTLDVREIQNRDGHGTGRYRRVAILSPTSRPRPLCDCDGGHPNPRSAAQCLVAARAVESLSHSPLAVSIVGTAEGPPGPS
jgi:hypothetical protein